MVSGNGKKKRRAHDNRAERRCRSRPSAIFVSDLSQFGISTIMDQSHRIWLSNGSVAHVARFVEPPDWAGSIAGLPLRKQVALGLSSLR